MSDPLSQDMIDALLNGISAPQPAPSSSTLDASGQAELTKFGNVCMEAGLSTLLILLNIPVSIPMQGLQQTNAIPGDSSRVLVHLPATLNDQPIDQYFLLTPSVTAAITDLMMGGDGKNLDAPVDELQLSAVSEAVNQMVGAAVTTITAIYGKRMEIAPPSASLIEIPDGLPFQEVVRLDYELNIEGVVSGAFIQFMAAQAAQTLVGELKPKVEKPAPKAPASPSSPSSQPMEVERSATVPEASRPMPEVRPVEFAPLVAAPQAKVPSGLDLILDVPLRVTVELGRTKMQVRNILDLSKGSLVELDKLAGEPVDLFVNGKLIAKGEVVVIDENFGVRVTDIVSHVDRVKSLRD